MKTKHVIAAGMFACAVYTLKGQFYGQNSYLTASSAMIISSAEKATIHSTGFLTGAYNNTNNFGPLPVLFTINKTDLSGQYGSSSDFWGEYKVYKDDSNCSTFPMQNTPDYCIGVSVIETGNSSTPATGEWYAMTGGFYGVNAGHFCVFATIDKFGNVVNRAYYDLPATAIGSTAPIITESTTNPGKYFISGSYSDSNGSQYVYIICVDNLGTVQWSNYYDAGGSTMRSTDIIMSPYNNNELIVIGATSPDQSQQPFYNLADNGFFMKVDASNGSVILYKIYGEDSNTSPMCNQFWCISPANSTNGGSNGFVLGGLTDPTLTNPVGKGSWIVKLSPNGNLIWSKIIGTSPVIQNIVYGIEERLNPFNGNYEYFASAREQHPTVYRLNANGTMYGAGNNKYEYTGINAFWPIYLTDVNNSGSADDGIQVYTTDPSNDKDAYFVKAYYNGVSGCQENLTTEVQFSGPQDVYIHNVITTPGPNQGTCSSFDLDLVNSGASISNYCSSTSIGTGSNAKPTNLVETIATENSTSISPNPTSGLLKFEFAKNVTGNIKIELINGQGQLVEVLFESTGNKQEKFLEVDLSQKNFSHGVYFVKISSDTSTKIEKIIFNN